LGKRPRQLLSRLVQQAQAVLLRTTRTAGILQKAGRSHKRRGDEQVKLSADFVEELDLSVC
jgi:hypothetical protein